MGGGGVFWLFDQVLSLKQGHRNTMTTEVQNFMQYDLRLTNFLAISNILELDSTNTHPNKHIAARHTTAGGMEGQCPHMEHFSWFFDPQK